MPTPSAVFPEVQEAIQISEDRYTLTATMPTPELTPFTLNIMPDGSFQISGQAGPITDQQLSMLKDCATQLERQLIGGDGVGHTPISQPAEDTVDYSPKVPPQSCSTYPAVDTSSSNNDISTSVQVHTPDDVKKKPCYNFFDEQNNLLEQIALQIGIPKGGDEVEEQLVLGVDDKLSFQDKQNNGCQQNEEFAKKQQLPDLPAFSDSFELEETAESQLFDKDPLLYSTIKQEKFDELANWGDKSGNQTVQETLDLRNFSKDFGKDSNTGFDDMAYRDPPPSVGSVMSDTYPSVMSPQNTFEAIEESSVCAPQKQTDGHVGQKVVYRRNSKRRVSGGKDLKRLMSRPKTPKTSMGKLYPPATASNGRISRVHGEYHESSLHDGWWNMLKNVERFFQAKTDFQSLKVEVLRKYCQNLFAVVLFSPSGWGNNQKRKGIYRLCLKDEYGWDPSVPFCSLNNSPKNKKKKNGADVNDLLYDPPEVDADGDAPRAKKDDLVAMSRYLMTRYEDEIRPKVMLRTDQNKLIRLGGVPVCVAPISTAVASPPPPPPTQIGNTVRNYIAAKADAVKAEPVIATESDAWNFPAPVTTLATATETSSYVAMETENNTTLDFNEVLKIMGHNILMTTDGDLSSLNIQPREQESQMDTDSGLVYKNPEMKGDVKTVEPTTPFAKVKLEHSYSREDAKEAFNQELPGMTVTHDSAIPGAVLQLAETKANPSMVQTINRNQYFVEKMAEKLSEKFPSEFNNLMEIMNQAGM